MNRFLLLLLLLAVGPCTAAQVPSYAQVIARHRETYRAEFLKTANSPLKTPEAVAQLRFYAPDSAYRLRGTFVRTPEAEPFQMPTTEGTAKMYVAYGRVTFRLADGTHTLTLYRNLELSRLPLYRDYLFIPFRDATNGQTTYGGGRYLDIRTGAIQNGQLDLDFNKAYNPYCAYADGFACPIPPRENWLKVPIAAGEQTYGAPKP
jgi:uncharacterized protein (DUF1684 family)